MDGRIFEIQKHLSKKLDAFRFEHTLGVSFTCLALAMRYGCDPDQAELAGLLHDCAKRYDDATLLEKCRKRQIPITEGEEREPSLLHAKLGAWMAREKYGVTDQEILDAIVCHTTGKPQMTRLDKILYVADYIEPRRYKAENLPEMRRLAFIDLDEACCQIMESILEYLRSRNCAIDEMTVLACESLREEILNKQKNHQEEKEESISETFKGTGQNCRRGVVREKRRRRQNYRH